MYVDEKNKHWNSNDRIQRSLGSNIIHSEIYDVKHVSSMLGRNIRSVFVLVGESSSANRVHHRWPHGGVCSARAVSWETQWAPNGPQ